MQIQVRRVEYRDVEALRDLYRQEANCQIIRDSFLPRGLADPFLILVGGEVRGYGAVANRYDKGQFPTIARGTTDPALRTRTRKVAWKASSASWWLSRRRQTPQTIGPCRLTR